MEGRERGVVKKGAKCGVPPQIFDFSKFRIHLSHHPWDLTASDQNHRILSEIVQKFTFCTIPTWIFFIFLRGN